MEAILTFIEETGKKLNRSITDLDDIRIAMSALKEIRELQISIDSQIGPIEVASGNVACMGTVSTEQLFSVLKLNSELWKCMNKYVLNAEWQACCITVKLFMWNSDVDKCKLAEVRGGLGNSAEIEWCR